MQLVAEWNIEHDGKRRTIELLLGDLSQIPADHAVDILVVSAFPDDYTPTPESLIGALYRAGISVAQLARSKQTDMRTEFSCWLSQPVIGASSFRHILCIESGWRGTPPETTDDLFRALVPFLATEFPDGSVAMPLIGSGDQGYDKDLMLESLLKAAVAWIKRGLSIRVLKIVIFSPSSIEAARKKFLEVQRNESIAAFEKIRTLESAKFEPTEYDIFLSYAHENSEFAGLIVQTLEKSFPGMRIFYDKKTITPGDSWLMEIAEALDNARRVAVLYTPEYWKSKNCKDEFQGAWIRQNDLGVRLLYPIYLVSAKIPSFFKSLDFTDCREADRTKLAEACQILGRALT
jgi:hypothetical protein